MTTVVDARTRYLRTPEGHRLAYVDTGGTGRPVLALHGAYGRGRVFLDLAERLGPDYRVIAVDQRGHGLSDHPGDYGREAFLRDAAAVIEQLDLAPALVVGHSLGGINAVQLAARRPELVAAAVVVDIGAEIDVPEDTEILRLPARFPTLEALRVAIARATVFGVVEHFAESAVEDEHGWRFLWRAEEVHQLKRAVCGAWWEDWTASAQPLLLVRGGDSPLIPPALGAEMVRRRPNTELVTIDGAGHDLYLSHADQFAAVVRRFLDQLPASAAPGRW
ncbi:Pimeloyl-ACP methyl ester carboxylesterase [Streptoalloteichus tenebrarius]|uniref:Pimeloyl-ACP methyl ester carboxylesterase n=1 Tax=Streptoalloteichus tenebrarius (strain ATCC 17920 / DSM 40477 / JCM 4838 / CBS 697.72 / NBRC 16177 / NCIMB 11028 / NRRL B-12390 / A12253. 1 / ISP 5477) TaxID=1933 RepID=A0ABT1I418_STRSD|nr:alpha/beta hydrolase [Streptoalloteichus tenebrarius]MCP2262542.1 Pimeloyl-ACP methyl ester carboxylesterase [Streptoalloteichus tenebrarius]BFE98660.1 alpha/beta hydrolase [Streptoalloteichus tenebrarius]